MPPSLFGRRSMGQCQKGRGGVCRPYGAHNHCWIVPRTSESAWERSFAPLGLWIYSTLYPGLTPGATFWCRSAA